MMQAATILENDPGQTWNPVLDHIVECDTCLGVIVDLTLPTSACETRCRDLRELLQPRPPKRHQDQPAARGARLFAMK